VPDPTVDLVLAALDRAYDKKSWHGTNLRGAVRGIRADLAAWRPAPDRHNAWEYTLHAAYWKYVVRRKITGEARGSFPLEGSSFFPRPEKGRATEAAWKADRALLEEQHRLLRQAVVGLFAKDLARQAEGSKYTLLELVTGAAAHDLYHAGQIQLLKRLAKTAG
jgi:hypothetical protein